MVDMVGPEALGKRMFAGWVRQQVDFGSYRAPKNLKNFSGDV